MEEFSQQKTKAVLIRQQEELQTILDSARAWIFYKDKHNRLLRVNKAFAQGMGMSKEQLEGKSVFDLFPQEQAQAFWEDDKEVMISGKPKVNIIEPVQSATGMLWMQTDKIPYRDSEGNIIGIIGFASDITERKLLEQRKDEFLSVASHELKTPLATIKAYAQILGQHCRHSKDQFFALYLSKLEFQIDRLAELVNQLLDASKAQGGKLKLIRERFNLANLTKDIAEDMQQMAKDYRITVKGSTKKYILADKHRIGQVLINLISNAIKYSPKADKVLIQIVSDGKNVKVSVKDFGIGIKKRDLEKIFERFYQVENRIRVSHGGLGLGLYISKQIIKEHHGEIWAESEKGKGSTFIFKLPINNK